MDRRGDVLHKLRILSRLAEIKGVERMKQILHALFFAVLLSLDGCVQISEFTMTDLQRAAVIATKGKDDIAATCYTYLANAIAAQLATMGDDTNGLISAYEQIRVLRNQSTQGRKELEAQCGALAMDIVVTIGHKAMSRGMVR
jgi:hypothetical protein